MTNGNYNDRGPRRDVRWDDRRDDFDQGRGPPPRDDFSGPDRGPPGPAGGNYAQPHERQPAAPPQFKPPLQPNQVPKIISIIVIVGIVLMFVGMMLLTIATPTNPPPEVPKEPDESYSDDYNDWERDYGNDYRNKQSMMQYGMIIHDVGALLAGLVLLAGGLMLNSLDIKLRTTMIFAGVILIVIMFMIPFAWSSLSPPNYGPYY